MVQAANLARSESLGGFTLPPRATSFAALASRADGFSTGSVEGHKRGVGRGPAPEGVNPAAVSVFSQAGDPLVVVINQVPHSLRLRRKYAGAEHLGTE